MLQPASQNVLCATDHNNVFLISGRSVATIGIELSNLFSKLFMCVSISLTNASDGIQRAFCTSTRKGQPEPNIWTWKISSIIQDFIIWAKIAARKADLLYIHILSSSGVKLIIVTLTDGMDAAPYYLQESKHIILSVFYPLLNRKNLKYNNSHHDQKSR